MSEEISAQALSSTKTVTVKGAMSGDADLPQDEDVLEQVQKNLVKGGVKPAQAATVAHELIAQINSYYSGPIPSSREFAAYEQICPGAARDILNMAKDEQAHRSRMDIATLKSEVFLQGFTIAAACVIICVIVAGAIYAASIGHDSVGITIASGSGLALVVGAIARMQIKRQKESQPQVQPAKPAKKRR